MQLSLESLLPISVILKHVIEDVTVHGRNKKNIVLKIFYYIIADKKEMNITYK